MVKLADRITNLQPPPGHWGADRIARYREEGRLILNELGHASIHLAERLRDRLRSYPGEG